MLFALMHNKKYMNKIINKKVYYQSYIYLKKNNIILSSLFYFLAFS